MLTCNTKRMKQSNTSRHVCVTENACACATSHPVCHRMTLLDIHLDVDLRMRPLAQQGAAHRQACTDAGEDFVCVECGMWCTSQNNIDQHLAGWPHSVRIECVAE